MLPLTVTRAGYQPVPTNVTSSSNQKGWVSEYFRKMIDYGQMDFQIVFSQMVQLCRSPNEVYRSTQYRKQIKNQWARDDPAFIVVLVSLLLCSTISYCIAFGVDSISELFLIIFRVIFIDFIGIGFLVAFFGRWFGMRYMKQSQSRVFIVDQEIEFLYCFDVHCNAFFPVFLILHVLQFFLLPVILSSAFYAILLSNTLYLIAFVVYYYVSYLGYSALPFLCNQQYLLFPITGGVVTYLIFVVLHINIAQVILELYF